MGGASAPVWQQGSCLPPFCTFRPLHPPVAVTTAVVGNPPSAKVLAGRAREGGVFHSTRTRREGERAQQRACNGEQRLPQQPHQHLLCFCCPFCGSRVRSMPSRCARTKVGVMGGILQGSGPLVWLVQAVQRCVIMLSLAGGTWLNSCTRHTSMHIMYIQKGRTQRQQHHTWLQL